jgi:hypothetical protein
MIVLPNTLGDVILFYIITPLFVSFTLIRVFTGLFSEGIMVGLK